MDSVLAEYIGCYKDNANDRAMTGLFRELGINATVERCVNTCRRKGNVWIVCLYVVHFHVIEICGIVVFVKQFL